MSEPVAELTSGGGAALPLGVYSRPKGGGGWRDWVTTVDHKKIGILYGGAALFFFGIGGFEALLIRLQLATPNGTVVGADLYNQLYTMHGVTMVFLVIMPLAAAFANYLLPLQIGARDVAFPRLNAMSFWLFLAGGLFLNFSWLVGDAPDGGWFAYAPNTGVTFSPGHGMDFYAIGLQIAGIASLVSAMNLIVTVLNMRAPGMTLFKMPVFTWMILVVQFLLLFAIPVITVALFLLLFDRNFGANFFNPEMGADPLLWQHLFWIFGHPEVYVLILPSFGIVSEVIPTFSRKPLFGYEFMVFSGIAIGFMGWGVWAHHMFVSGIGPISIGAFTLSTMFIAVPTGVKILNWLATMWGGKIRLTASMLFATGVVSMFTIGGLSGVTHAVSPADTQQTDTYYIVAHFHYVIFGGALLGFFSGFYFWWPKVFGHRLGETLGKWNFWLMIVGFNMTFGPMHILGLNGMSRRIDTYSPGFGFEFWNLFATVGAFVIAFGVLCFAMNVILSARRARGLPPEPPDPWDARSLEWFTPNPTPVHNFDEIVEVSSLDEFWHRKWTTDENGRVVRRATAAEVCQTGDADDVHLPSPSYWPVVVAAGLPLVGFGLLYNLWICVPGTILVLIGVYAWVFEPPDDPDGPFGGGHGDEGHGDEGHGETEESASDESAPQEEAASVE
ncbi:MAG: cytochrome c oxidase subunit I [Acidimicrobiales bacterium]|nr:cytochrome c oxidase subunit I [Acidimicrobiales bacterium]